VRWPLCVCLLRTSGEQSEFTAEVSIYFTGPKNLDKPGVFKFTMLSVRLDFGISWFATPKTELTLLTTGTATNESVNPEESVHHVGLRVRTITRSGGVCRFA